jgi:hypothetical protein
MSADRRPGCRLTALPPVPVVLVTVGNDILTPARSTFYSSIPFGDGGHHAPEYTYD